VLELIRSVLREMAWILQFYVLTVRSKFILNQLLLGVILTIHLTFTCQ